MLNALRKEQPSFSPAVKQEKPWIAARREIRLACRQYTEEEIALFECAGLSGWESR